MSANLQGGYRLYILNVQVESTWALNGDSDFGAEIQWAVAEVECTKDPIPSFYGLVPGTAEYCSCNGSRTHDYWCHSVPFLPCTGHAKTRGA